MPIAKDSNGDFQIWLCVERGLGYDVLSLPEDQENTMDLVEIFETLARK